MQMHRAETKRGFSQSPEVVFKDVAHEIGRLEGTRRNVEGINANKEHIRQPPETIFIDGQSTRTRKCDCQ